MGKSKTNSPVLPLSILVVSALLLQFCLSVFTLTCILIQIKSDLQEASLINKTSSDLLLRVKLSDNFILVFFNTICIFLSLLGFFGYFFQKFKIIVLHSVLSILFGSSLLIYLIIQIALGTLSYKVSILAPIYCILIGVGGILYYNLYESEYGERGEMILSEAFLSQL